MKLLSYTACISISFLFTCPFLSAVPEDFTRPSPTHADVAYGPHPEAGQVLDFYKAESNKPTPLVVYIHGGGFRTGDKSSVSDQALHRLLGNGISVASLNYRMLPDHKLPTPHHDCKRAIQFLRSQANNWNIDPERIGAFGGSAGAQLSMWLAFTPDMADPDSEDPIARQSTRLKAVSPAAGQASIDFDQWDKWLPKIKGGSGSYTNKTWKARIDANSWKEAKAIIDCLSAINLITPDDPPVLLKYYMAPDAPLPEDPKEAQSVRIHHVNFGFVLQEKLNANNVENYLTYPGHVEKYASIEDFLIDKL